MSSVFESALVTGGAGFIGSHLVEALVADGCRVTVLDDLSSGRESNLAPVAGRITFMRGSICDREIVDASGRRLRGRFSSGRGGLRAQDRR